MGEAPLVNATAALNILPALPVSMSTLSLSPQDDGILLLRLTTVGMVEDKDHQQLMIIVDQQLRIKLKHCP